MNDVKKTLKQLYDLLPYREGDKFRIIEECTVALEKQIPKRSIYHEQTEKYYEYHECPNCEDIFDASTTSLRYKYCPECGQLLDWSVEE